MKGVSGWAEDSKLASESESRGGPIKDTEGIRQYGNPADQYVGKSPKLRIQPALSVRH
jgi:hypothetical protein